MSTVYCYVCRMNLEKSDFDLDLKGRVMFTFCKSCSDRYRIDKVPVECSSCSELMGPENFVYHRKRFKINGLRMIENRICKDCRVK